MYDILLVICLGLVLFIPLLLAGLDTLNLCISYFNGNRSNRLALVPASGVHDPLEQSSWVKLIQPHIRYLARYIHVPPDLDGVEMPEELHQHMEVLAMLQNQFQAGRFQRIPVSGSLTDLVLYRNR